MYSIFRNPEFKSILVKMFFLQIIFSVLLFCLADIKMAELNKSISERNIALAGEVLSRHPELEKDITGLITGKASESEIAAGRNILEQYGYKTDLGILSQPLLGNVYKNFGIYLAAFTLMWAVPLFILIKIEYSRMYSKVRKISKISECVIEGDFSSSLPEDTEGDFGILGHQFNQMSGRLKLSIERDKKDKKFLKDIISDISHQLKTPLTSLITFNDLMLNDKQMPDETRRDFLLKSKSQLDRMEWLIISLLKLARLEAGAIDFKKEKSLLTVPAEAALSSLAHKISQKNISIEVNSETENIFYSGDNEWTAEALTNIIKNCTEHTKKGGSIKVILGETPLFSRIIIKDNGEGIDKKDLPHIFERFYTGNSSVKAEGIGIGLALARLIIEGQNGTVTVRSEKGLGTEFTITFLKKAI
ncbi:MAG: HAMP domain-containing sensor histidine kinase [Bacillota bacterium]|nr:HAMP domain-containing sensor histidine kinase [Bacillota bacterium]